MKEKKIDEISPAQSTKSARRIPWWVNVLLAIGSYCTLKYVVPELHLTHPTLQKLAQAAPTFAPLTTLPFLLLAAKQLYDVDIDEVHKNKPDDGPDENPKK
ncbi:hypothetical protein [Desulfocastanea catecholica]